MQPSRRAEEFVRADVLPHLPVLRGGQVANTKPVFTLAEYLAYRSNPCMIWYASTRVWQTWASCKSS